jgi:hypothetical protein
MGKETVGAAEMLDVCGAHVQENVVQIVVRICHGIVGCHAIGSADCGVCALKYVSDGIVT